MRISQAIIEIEEGLRHDESLKRMMNQLEQNLTREAKRKYFLTIACPFDFFKKNFLIGVWK